jgi:hypothetical protein
MIPYDNIVNVFFYPPFIAVSLPPSVICPLLKAGLHD